MQDHRALRPSPDPQQHNPPQFDRSQMLKSAATLISASARGRGFRIRDKQRWTLRGNRTSLRNPTSGFILANDFAHPKYI
jgi:hypothetical protein